MQALVRIQASDTVVAIPAVDCPKGGDAGAGARAGPHPREDFYGDQLSRPRCRVGKNVVYCAVFYAENAHEFPCCI
jgi:hypothetical protein